MPGEASAGSVQVKVAPDTSRFAEELRAELAALSSSISDLNVNVTPNLDTTARDRVRQQLASLANNRSVRINTSAETRGAQTALDRLTRDRTVNVRVRTSGGLGSLGSGANNDAHALATLISLAPALVPIAASLGQSLGTIALQGGAATIAIGAFAAAVVPQISQFSDLSKAQKAASDAVGQYGAASDQAAKAQDAVAGTLNSMPAATKKAAGQFLVLKDDFHQWSDSLAGFTMKPVSQGLADVDLLLPSLTPLVKGASDQFTRLTTLLAGGINSASFDDLSGRFDKFANGALKSAVDGITHFARLLSEGSADGPIQSFISYAQKVGPQVKDTLENLAKAVGNIAQGASQAGPGMLTLVNAVAKIVAALPPSVISALLQAYSAFRLISLTSTGITAVANSFTRLSTQVSGLRGAATTAGSGLSGLRGAFSSLSTGMKASVIILAITGIVVAVDKLSNLGKSAPPNVDKLTTALGELALTGKTSGEAARVFGDNLDGLYKKVQAITDPSTTDKIQQGLVKVFSLGFANSTPNTEAKQAIDAIDKSLANLVQNGNAAEAAQALKDIEASFTKSGKPVTDLTSHLDDYDSALADVAFQNQLTAESEGPFGEQAQAVQQKLDAQQQSAQGLIDSLQALSDTNRSVYDTQSDLEAAIDAASDAVKNNGKALHETNGQLDLGTEKARNNYGALSDLADKTEQAAAAALKDGKSQSQANKIMDEGRTAFVHTAEQMGLTKDQANKLADAILKIPKSHSTKLSASGNAASVADAARRAIDNLPSEKIIYIKGISEGAGLGGHTLAATGALFGTGGVRRMADGGMGRQAMIAKGGSSILWAEAGNEAYVPIDRRPRSRAIASQAVSMMGGRVDWGTGARTIAAAVGMVSASTIPVPSQAAPQPLVLNVSGSNQAFLAWLRQAVKEAGGNVQTALGQAGR